MFRSVYIPVGVPTFDQTAAADMLQRSTALLREIAPEIDTPEGLLLGADKVSAFTDGKAADLAVIQNITFANGAYTAEALRKLDCPVLLWTPEEPFADTGRLKLNALTGAFSAANMLTAFGRPYCYVYGSPDDPRTKKELVAVFAAARVKKQLQELRVLQVGHTPQGFGFGRALDGELQAAFGCDIVSIEARELIDKAKTFTDEDAAPYLDKAKQSICGLEKIDEKNVRDFARLYKAYDEYVKENHAAGRISSLPSARPCARCWPC